MKRLLAAALLAASIGGCAAQTTREAPVVVIVVAHHRNEAAPALSADELAWLHDVAANPDDDGASALVVAAGRPGADVVDLEPRRPNGEIERGSAIERLVDGRLDALRDAILATAADTRDVDLLRVIDDAARSGTARILVLSAGLSVVDPLDLRVAGWDRDPGELARELAGAGRLPDLTGRTVVFTGLGRTAGRQPALGPYEQARLRAIWLALCTAAGGRCSVDDGVRDFGRPVSSLDPPVVAVPAPVTTGDTVSVPTSVLFGPDSCALVDRAAALDVLAPIGARLRTGAITVAISGRTAPVGPGDGLELSACRARAAAALLHDLDVPDRAVTSARGDGDLLDPPAASRDARGVLDRDKLAALRRVVFTLTPTKERR